MNEKLKAFKAGLKDKKICVVGIGISHLPLIHYLAKNGAKVTACDRKSYEDLGETARELEALGVSLCLGEEYVSSLSGDLIFKTPGMRPDIPELLAAEKAGAKITTEMEVFMDLCPAPITAITGSDGKTTTTTLCYKLLSMAGFTTHVGGNIGAPLLPEIDNICAEDRVVLELSSFQLMTMKQSPQVAVVTNITPNHLDYHKDYQEYIDAKLNIFSHQGENDLVILNLDNPVTAECTKQAKGRVLTFSRKQKADIWLDGTVIRFGEEAVLDISDIKIPGMHNVENYMAAIGAVYGDVKKEHIEDCAKNFGGVAHRIEFVREIDGVRYYNSSIDSSPNRTINTLKVFSEPVVLIAGGKDKGIPYDDLGPALADGVKALVLIGATAKIIGEVAKKAAPHVPAFYVDSYEEAVLAAKNQASGGDVVLMSNASTSFDLFKNFEERGNLFKELVNRL